MNIDIYIYIYCYQQHMIEFEHQKSIWELAFSFCFLIKKSHSFLVVQGVSSSSSFSPKHFSLFSSIQIDNIFLPCWDLSLSVGQLGLILVSAECFVCLKLWCCAPLPAPLGSVFLQRS